MALTNADLSTHLSAVSAGTHSPFTFLKMELAMLSVLKLTINPSLRPVSFRYVITCL